MTAARKILIVDDEEIVRELLLDALSETDFIVETANSGPAAIENLKRPGQGIDLVVVDMSMPEMDGIEVCTEIRKIIPLQKMVISTGNYLSDDELAALNKAGVTEIISKPFNLAKMISLFEKLTA